MKRRDFITAAIAAALPAIASRNAEASHRKSEKSSANSSKSSSSKSSSKKSSGKTSSHSPSHSEAIHEHVSNTPAPRPRTPPSTMNESRVAAASLPAAESGTQWRSYELTTKIAIHKVDGPTRLWLPLATFKDSLWQRSLGHSWRGNFVSSGIYRDPATEMEVFIAEWAANTDPQLELLSDIETQDRKFDVTKRHYAPERGDILRRNLQSTDLLQINDHTKAIAERIVGRVKDPLAQGKAIYDWTADRAMRDAEVSNLIGNNPTVSLDTTLGHNAIHALNFVVLCRAIGLPARPVFGLRCDRSNLFPSLGETGELNQAFNCRAEFYAPGYDWIPVNPADVRQVVQDEKLSPNDTQVSVLKKLLFGYWEMNWIALNTAVQVVPRKGNGSTLPFLVRPYVEVGGKVLDTADADRYSLSIKSTRI